jgi:YesN/AraC family two-component response regulator
MPISTLTDNTETKSRSLLVVDDEAEIREMVLDDLRKYDIRIFTAENGQAALELLRKEQIDGVLSDIRMPKMDGITFLKEVRKSGMLTPFVFLTAFSEKEYFLSALKLSVIDFISKPYEKDELLRSVTYALNLGLKLRTLEAEVAETLKSHHVPPEKIGQFQNQLKEVLMLHKVNDMNAAGKLPLKRKAA